MQSRTPLVVVAPVTIAILVALAGCSSAPSRDSVVERLLIELETENVPRDHPYNVELADILADDALAGDCGDDEYWRGLLMAPPSQKQYAWAATCSMYFESDMTQDQLRQAKDLVIEQALGQL